MLSAVIRTLDGKQHRVILNSVIGVEKMNSDVGESVELDAMFVSDNEGNVELGVGKVRLEVLEHKKADKIVVFKKKRRKGYKRKQGHRQRFTVLKVREISK
ncbi:50S ribosomal protein L21 [Anaplasmataceae bacterium AB001_6]|nr:50S ribosomal protein L21 [Anaplasmataceae bacterium AB001_6]